jgi:hypothetical protein
MKLDLREQWWLARPVDGDRVVHRWQRAGWKLEIEY